MKSPFYLLGLSVLIPALIPRSTAQSPKPQPGLPAAPVVVELFTSEGCSSCPPADALLAKMEATQPFEGVQIIAIEEHVDYWDQQGWVDPFSSNEWTVRTSSSGRVASATGLPTSDASYGPGWSFSSRGPAFHVEGTTAW